MPNLTPPWGTLKLAPTADELAALLTEELLHVADRATSATPASVALSGGTTPAKVYDHLVARLRQRPRADEVFERLGLFWGDERRVPPADPASNVGLAITRWFAPLGMKPAALVPPRFNLPFAAGGPPADLPAAAAAYNARLVAHFGSLERARFDVVMLGMGDEGHTASLFPGVPALADRAPAVVATHAPAYVAPLPTERLSFNLPLINQARQVWVILTGPAKRARLAEVWGTPRRPGEMPIQGVDPAAGELIWWVSQDAMP